MISARKIQRARASQAQASSRRRASYGAKACACALAVALASYGVAVPAGAFAAQTPQENDVEKREVVYATLQSDGQARDAYVVNILEPESAGSVVDFGPYDQVENLTVASELVREGDATTVQVTGDLASYQGTVRDAQLPWNIDIVYTLDGVRIDAEDLGGKTGVLEIAFSITGNENVDATYYDNYLMQVSVSMPQDKARSVQAPDGQIAMAGSNAQVTFMVMPGKDAEFSVKADVVDFEMAGMSFAAVPLALGMSMPDGESLVSQFDQLIDGVGLLNSGAGSLAGGVASYAEGVGDMAEQVPQLASGVSGLASGAVQIADGVEGVFDGLRQYQQALFAQAEAASQGVQSEEALQAQMQAAFQAYASAYAAAYGAVYPGAYATAYAAALASGLPAEAAAAQAAAQAGGQAAYAAMQDAQVLAAMAQIGEASQAAAESAGAQGAAEALQGAAEGIGSQADAGSLLGGVAALAGGAQDVADGADALEGGAEQLSWGAEELADGAESLAQGAESLSDGTDELYEEVQQIPDAVTEEIEAMMAEYDKSDYVPVSFASPKNTNVTLVQFVFSTEPITAPEAEEPEQAEQDKGIIDRFLDLFR